MLQHVRSSDHIVRAALRVIVKRTVPHVQTTDPRGRYSIRVRLDPRHIPPRLAGTQQKHPVATTNIEQATRPARQVTVEEIELLPQWEC